MAEAAQQGYITHELAEQFKHVKGLKQVANKDRRKAHSRTAISKSDMQRIVDAPEATTPAGAMHRALLLTLATYGMRINEAVSLKVMDLQWETNDNGAGWVAYVLGKNMEKPEARPLGKQAKEAIDAWLTVRAGLGVVSEYIFTGFGGRGSRNPSAKPINRVSAWEIVQRYAKALDLAHIKPHDFRRFVGTQLAKKDIRLAQKQLGHKRIETTAQHYVLDDTALGVTDSLL
jgi:integrase